VRISAPILLLGLGLLALFLWAWNKSKQPGSSGGVFSQITGLWSGASGFTQNVTEGSLKTGETIGGGVKDAAGGIVDIVDKFDPIGSTIKGWF